jgi:hypothetical protein
VLLVLASDPYEPRDYIRDYDEFLELLAGRSEVAANGVRLRQPAGFAAGAEAPEGAS